MNHQLEIGLFQLKKSLLNLKEEFAFYSLKGGTETEDMDYDEIKFLQSLAKDTLPVKIKIGGPEARTDIRFCHSVGIEAILAPMIESEYALKNFISSLKSLIPSAQYQKIKKSINLETIVGYRNLLDIADSKWFEELDNVTAARSDLSASMELKPDDPEVMRVTAQIVKISKERGKKTSVGGTITKSNFEKIVDLMHPDQINSRHVIVDISKALEKNTSKIPEAMLEFEMELYNLLGQLKPEKAGYYRNRIELNQERSGQKKILYSFK